MSCIQGWLKGFLNESPLNPQRRKIEGEKKSHRKVTEFGIRARGDALSSKSLQAKWSIWLPEIIPQLGPERANKGLGSEGK